MASRTKKATVATPCPQYAEMAKHWDLPVALLGSTLEMREAGQKFLPREPKESQAAYNNRLNRTVLYGAYKRTIQSLAGLPFHRAANVTGEPTELSYLIEDCDSDGSDITDFSHQLLTDVLIYNITHFLVDMPEVGETVTLEEKDKYKIRPYFSHLSPANIIAWTSEQIGGVNTLTSIRIKEQVVVEDGEWGFATVDQIRVITQTEHTFYQMESKDKWVKVGEPIPNSLGYIPLVTIYGTKDGFMTATPPLEDLAWLNLRHYQKLSDLDNIEHVANVPLLLATGVDEGQLEGVSIGPNSLINLSSENAKLAYVEHSGAAIGASQSSIEKLEERMASMGADIVIRKSVDRQTAASRKIDQSESISMLQMFTNNIETGIQQGFTLAGEWIDVVADKVVVSIGAWLDTGADGPNFVDILTQFLLDNKKMSVDEAVKELQRRGVISDTFEINEDSGEILDEEVVVEPVVEDDNAQPDTA